MTDFEAHGNFGITILPEITLITISGSWNLECTKIFFQVFIQELSDFRKSIGRDSLDKRYALIDARDWHLETEEARAYMRKAYSEAFRRNKKTVMVYIVSGDYLVMMNKIVSERKEQGEEGLDAGTVTSLEEAEEWLKNNGLDISLKSHKFPEARPAQTYLKEISSI
ncbi:MAG: hypothetical protein JXR86_11155 [Spirochaetales bacterium]|nr:hypothetical protein [Spirochaetales bacterium]